MITLEEAQKRVLAPLAALASEDVPLEECLGRVLAEPLMAVRSQPPKDNSAMDGYVLSYGDMESLPAAGRLFPVVETIPAGGWSERPLQRGEAVRIMTGAPLPPGDDLLVVIREKTDESDPLQVRVFPAKTEPGENIRRCGEDVHEGRVCLPSGRPLQPAHLGLAASQGFTTLRCVRRPVVRDLVDGG